jgi:hypothetical protein
VSGWRGSVAVLLLLRLREQLERVSSGYCRSRKILLRNDSFFFKFKQTERLFKELQQRGNDVNFITNCNNKPTLSNRNHIFRESTEILITAMISMAFSSFYRWPKLILMTPIKSHPVTWHEHSLHLPH